MREQLRKLLAPPLFPDDPEQSRVASLLNTLLLALTTIFVVNTAIAFFFNPAPEAFWLNAATVVTTIGLLTLLRLKYVRAAALITIAVFWLTVAGLAILSTGLTVTIVTSFFVLIVLASALTGYVTTIAFVVLTLLVGSLTAYLEITGLLVPTLPGTYLVNTTSAGGNLIVLTVVLMLTSTALRRALDDLGSKNAALEDARGSLETRVAERTRDLALAAEVGRRLSEVRQQEALLQNAVSLIQERFNLYHVQVYLVTSGQRSLKLQAGTGQVGLALRHQRHTLPIGPGSINGLAAGQQRPILVPDTATSSLFRPNPLLPDTRAELSVPLLVENRTLGVLNLQASNQHTLTEESIPAFETLASQLATALENATLFAAAQAARADAESYLRRLTAAGWERYLNAVDRPQQIGFVYDNQTLTPLTADTPPADPAAHVLQVPIQVAGQTVGAIHVANTAAQDWDDDARALVTAVSERVARQVENLRLLEDAQRFQAEAQNAVRRLTRQAWQEQTAAEKIEHGYTYDGRQILPLAAAADAAAPDEELVHGSLVVRGQPIASLELAGAPTADAQQLVTAVTAQLSTHLENLRLTAASERALAESQRRGEELAVINQVAQVVSQQRDVDQLLASVYAQIGRVVQMDAFHVGLYNPQTDLMDYPLMVTSDRHEQIWRATLHKTSNSYRVIHEGVPVLRNLTAAEVAHIRATRPPTLFGEPSEQITASLIFVPLRAGERVAGVLSVQSYALDAYGEHDVSLLSGVASYVSIALENARLFAEIQQQGEKERIINAVSQRILSTLSVEEALQTAVAELGQALQARHARVELALAAAENGRGAAPNGMPS